MQHITEFKKNEYLTQCSGKSCETIMKLRLDMLPARNNFKTMYDTTKCQACKEQVETSKHLLTCKVYKSITSHNININNYESKINEINWLKEVALIIQQIEEAKKILHLE